ncbi:hypothetical protein L195_g059839, partial [Trifolium pratense]
RNEAIPRNSPPREERRARHSPRRCSPRRATPPRQQRRRSPAEELPLPAGLEKPPVMDTYNGSTDPEEHIENLEALPSSSTGIYEDLLSASYFPPRYKKEQWPDTKACPRGPSTHRLISVLASKPTSPPLGVIQRQKCRSRQSCK